MTSGVLKEECDSFYRPYRTFVTQGRPFVILKVATTLDGMVATATGESQWVTGPQARKHGHQLRDRVDAILVGRGTVEKDDPRLTTRLGRGKRGHDPIRIVLDSQLRIHPDTRLLHVRSRAPTFVMTTDGAPRSKQHILEQSGTQVFRCRTDPCGQVDLTDMLSKLAKLGVMTLLVEGGPTIQSRFLAERLADRLSLYMSMKLLGKALPMFPSLNLPLLNKAIPLQNSHWEAIGADLWITGEIGSH